MGDKRRAPEPHPAEEAVENGLVALHRSRLWDWSPSAVVAIAACPGAPLAAVAYETGDLELWDLLHMACIQVDNRSDTPQQEHRLY
jgi:U3 small nucleolar RNA-associated protein 4